MGLEHGEGGVVEASEGGVACDFHVLAEFCLLDAVGDAEVVDVLALGRGGRSRGSGGSGGCGRAASGQCVQAVLQSLSS